MKRLIIFAVFFAMLLLLSSSCKKTDTVKIGLIMELSGRSSSLGIVARNAVQMAVDDYNGLHQDQTKSVELIIKDTKGDGSLVEGLLEDFEKQGVQIIIGPITSNTASEIIKSDYYKYNKMLFISPTVTSSAFSKIDDAFITLMDVNEKQGQLLAESALLDQMRKIAIVYEEDNKLYTAPIANSFQTGFVRGDGIITYNKHFKSSENAPFGEIAEDIVDSNPDGILICAGDVDAAQLSQYIYKLNSDLRIYSGLWAKTEDFIQKGSKAIEGAILIATYDEENSRGKTFKEAYIKRFGSGPTFSGFHSYDAAQLLLGAIDSGTVFEPSHMKKYLLEKSTFQSISGTIHIDKFGDCDRPYLLVEVIEGHYVKAD